MNASARDKIIKSWSGVSEVTLIKEVVTKGENVDLCIEYWAKKRKMPLEEYKLFFQDVVQTYVYRLLTERLVCKAETVLRNVERNVCCFYYQFVCESEDAELREMVLDHLRRKEPQNFGKTLEELRFYWDLLQDLKQCPKLMEQFKAEMRRINLETLMSRDEAFRRRLMVEVYFEKRNSAILSRLTKCVVWDHLVRRQDMQQLVRWCTLRGFQGAVASNELEEKYCQWVIDAEMVENALKTLQNPSEVLRNCFAKEGYFFADERLHAPMVLRRVCTTQSIERNQEVLSRLPIGKWLLERGYFMLLLRDFVTNRELQELSEVYPTHRNLLELLAAIKGNDIQTREGFQEVARVTQSYLESEGVDFEKTQPLVSLYEFLCSESTANYLSCLLHSSVSKNIPYLNSLVQRLNSTQSSSLEKNLPTPYELLRKFKNVDFKLITCLANNDEVVSFSNQRICQKYARKYRLNFLHYLHQQRSCFAVYYLLIQCLQQCGQVTRAQLFSATQAVTEITLQNADNLDLLTHCIAFNEMLGFDTQNLRSFLKLKRQLATASASPLDFGQLIESMDSVLVAAMEHNPEHFPLQDYQALMHIVACNQFKKWPALVMQRYARGNDWWQILVLMQYFDVPLKQLQTLTGHFGNRTVGEHLLRALLHKPTVTTADRMAKRANPSLARQHKQARKTDQLPPTSTSTSTLASSLSSVNDANAFFKTSSSNQLSFLLDSSGNLDLFAIILLSTNMMPEERIANGGRFLEMMQDSHSYCTSVNLMKNSIKFQRPVLSLLAATVTALNVDWNWTVWLAVATDQWREVQRVCLKNVDELAWTLVENCVRSDNIGTLYRSICIFYELNPLQHLTRFLHETAHNRNFGDEIINDLRLYLLAWSNDEIQIPLCSVIKREELMSRSIRLLLIHLQSSFTSAVEQRRLLQCICKSGISDISDLLDFCLLNEVFGMLQSSASCMSSFNFEQLLQRDGKAYEQLIDTLMASREYDLAISLASILHMSISDKIYTKWVAGVDDLKELNFQQYEDEIRLYSLPPELLVNFFLYAALRLESPSTRKYLLLKRALTVIKQNHLFPNESFDRDQIEYEMVMCYLQLPDAEEAQQLELYHSEYFEQIMLKERCVLYKSFLELKELAGIEDLALSQKVPLTEAMKLCLEALLNRLLDEGDIVEALRIQELFEYRPVDLRFVVFCMALAEGVTTIFSMSSEERQLLREVEKSAFAKFNKRTLGTLRSSGQSSPLKQINDLSDSSSTLEFEEIPSKEKRETLETIQGIVSRLKYGITIGTRILKAYRAAMYLDKEYLDVLRTKDVTVLLRSVAEDSCMYKLLVVSDITTSTQMTASEIADLLAFEITTAIVRPRFYIFTADQQAKSTFKNADLWGYNIDRDLHLLLELAPNTTALGNCLLEFCDALKAYRKYQDGKPYDHTPVFEKLSDIIACYGLPETACLQASGIGMAGSLAAAPTTPPQVLSHKKQNIIYVELLIKAHQCFVHECSMEGIANVLNRAKALNSVLTNAKSWSLVVRMLVGIGRYREMFYCFDALIENEQFESLLGQFDVEKTVVLRQAITAYLREYAPANNRELLKLAALHFLMYKDLAEMWEQDAQTLVTKVLNTALVGAAQLTEQNSMNSLSGGGGSTKTYIPKLLSSPELIALLQQAMENYTHATENYLLDNKLLMAQKSASQAELMAVQIDLASKALDKSTAAPRFCACVINVQTRDEFRELINAELRVPQALILSRANGYDINWAEVLLSQFVILTKQFYLGEYLTHFNLSDNIIENIIKGFQFYAQKHKTTAQMEDHLTQIIGFVKSITLKYKLASLLNMKSTVMSLINESSIFYLKDTNYGRSESQNMPDI